MQNEATVIEKRYINWKKATGRSEKHKRSACHSPAINQLQQLQRPSVCAQLSQQKLDEQSSFRSNLVQLFSTVRFLARQALPLWGHLEENGNYLQLLKLLGHENETLSLWLDRTTNFTSHDCQNEMLGILSQAVVRSIVSTVETESRQFTVVVDGTTVPGSNRNPFVFVMLTKTLTVNEMFVGLYNPSDTTGKTLSVVVKDMLTMLTLPIEDLRAQTYDGAANMSSRYNTCQAIIGSEQPLALFFHCSAHCANLVAQHTVATHQFLSDPLQLVQDPRAMYSCSVKFTKLFSDRQISLTTDMSDKALNKTKAHKATVSNEMAGQSFCSISSAGPVCTGAC